MYGAELFCGADTYSYMRGPLPENLGGTPLYTAEQLRAYALVERKACAASLDVSRADALLACGEMTAQEWRTVSAVLVWLQTRMRSNV